MSSNSILIKCHAHIVHNDRPCFNAITVLVSFHILWDSEPIGKHAGMSNVSSLDSVGMLKNTDIFYHSIIPYLEYHCLMFPRYHLSTTKEYINSESKANVRNYIQLKQWNTNI